MNTRTCPQCGSTATVLILYNCSAEDAIRLRFKPPMYFEGDIPAPRNRHWYHCPKCGFEF